MLRRRVLQATVGLAVAVAALLGTSSAASASPSSFLARYVHAGGTGSVAVQGTGGLVWYNRSVTATNVEFYVHAAECGTLVLQGLDSAGDVRSEHAFPDLCASATSGRTYLFGDVVLDGSFVSGGLTTVMIYAFDDTDRAYGYTRCLRSSSACKILSD